MSNSPPAKRLKQSSILDAFKRTGRRRSSDTPIEGTEVKKGDTDTQDKMFGENDPVKTYQNFRKAERNKSAEAAEERVTKSSSRRPRDKNTSPVSTSSEPCASVKKPEQTGDSQGSIASSSSRQEGRGSPLLFDSDIEDVPDTIPSGCSKDDGSTTTSMGAPISSLNTYPKCLPLMGHLNSSQGHTVLIKVPYKSGEDPIPYPRTYIDKWDADHVRMPCSPENLYPVEGNTGGKTLKNRWDVIQTALLSDISTSLDLEEAVLSYNTRYSQKWDFRAIHAFFSEALEADESEVFFTRTIPSLVRLALDLPQLCTQPIPMLKKGSNKSVTMSQHQAASLLANAFFCTFPRRNTSKRGSEYSTYPDINFNRLFQGGKHPKAHRKSEKLKCIMNYFRRVTTHMPQGNLTFRRQAIRSFPKWEDCSSKLTRLHVSAAGTIENDGVGMLQVDFANKFLGGGVLGFGCVQEEIRFLMCPELILSRLFTEELERNECLVMTGGETFSTYTGYADSFKWAGDFSDTTPRDLWERRCTEIVAIDALVFRSYADQFHENLVKRELNKAYCGFFSPGLVSKDLSAVASGNWGCGAFGGDKRLKALLQLMAAAEAKRDLCYFTFQDIDFMEDLFKIHEFLTNKVLSVGDLFNLIQQYYDNICVKSSRTRKPKMDLYEYIYLVYSGSDVDTDSTDALQDAEETNEETSKNSPDYAADTP